MMNLGVPRSAETKAWLQNSGDLSDAPVRQLRVRRLNN